MTWKGGLHAFQRGRLKSRYGQLISPFRGTDDRRIWCESRTRATEKTDSARSSCYVLRIAGGFRGRGTAVAQLRRGRVPPRCERDSHRPRALAAHRRPGSRPRRSEPFTVDARRRLLRARELRRPDGRLPRPRPVRRREPRLGLGNLRVGRDGDRRVAPEPGAPREPAAAELHAHRHRRRPGAASSATPARSSLPPTSPGANYRADASGPALEPVGEARA